MALWGSKDAGIGTMGLGSHLSLNYATKVITGSGTTFGRVGAAKTGDVLIIGSRASGGTFYGTGVIASIASTTACSVASTAGFSGDAISNVALWKVKESPTSSDVDSNFTTRKDSSASLNIFAKAEFSAASSVNDDAGVGRSVIALTENDVSEQYGIGLKAGDYYDTTTGPIVVDATGEARVTTLAATGIGETVVRIATPPGFAVGQFFKDQSKPVAGTGSTTAVALVGQGATTNYVTISNLAAHNILAGDTILTPVISTAVAIGTVNAGVNTISLVAGASSGTITAGMAITFYSDTIVTLEGGADIAINAGLAATVYGDYVSLGGKIPTATTVGASGTFKRYMGGYDNYIYGVAAGGVGAALSTTYEVAHGGWVGVQTYTDNQGNLRVKKEVLVAMSGITTENRGPFPAFPNVREQQ